MLKKSKKKRLFFVLSCSSNFSPFFSTLSKSNIPLSEENLFLKNCINTRVYRKNLKNSLFTISILQFYCRQLTNLNTDYITTE